MLSVGQIPWNVWKGHYINIGILVQYREHKEKCALKKYYFGNKLNTIQHKHGSLLTFLVCFYKIAPVLIVRKAQQTCNLRLRLAKCFFIKKNKKYKQPHQLFVRKIQY